MPIIPIYNCFHPVLKNKTEPVINIDDDLTKLVNDMFDTMHKAEGIGLAANQVGVSKSLFVVDIAKFHEKFDYPPLVLINPVITSFSDELVDYEEGCLSVPKLHEDVTRPKSIQINFFDINGKEHTLEADSLLSRVIQHETDHLNGILFFDRIHPLRKSLLKNKLKKIQKGDILPDYPMILPNGELIGK